MSSVILHRLISEHSLRSSEQILVQHQVGVTQKLDAAGAWLRTARESVRHCRVHLENLSSESMLDEIDLLSDLAGAGDAYWDRLEEELTVPDSASAESVRETLDNIRRLQDEISSVTVMLEQQLHTN